MPLGLHVGALGRPSWPQVGSKTGLATQFLTKSGFSKKQKKTQWFFNVFAPSDGAENDPRSTQDAPKTVLKSYVFDVQNYDRFWFVLGSILGAFGEALWLPKGYQKSLKFVSPNKGASKTPQGAPKRPQESPKRVPRGPRRTSREAPRGPKRPKRQPKRAPRDSKRHQEAPKIR